MNINLRYIITHLYVLFFFNMLNAQYSNNIRISDIDFCASESNIKIEYSVYNMTKPQEYCVLLYFVDVDSNVITPNYLSGDLLFQTNGRKIIICDIEKEHVSFKGDYYVKIVASKMQNQSYVKSITYSGIMPGLGSYMSRKKGPTYLWGLLGYGMVGSSIYFNLEAQNAKHSYLHHSGTPYEADDNFKQSLKHKSISNISASIAIIIWSVFITDAIIATKQNRQVQLHPEKVEINVPYISSVSKTKPLNTETSTIKQSKMKEK